MRTFTQRFHGAPDIEIPHSEHIKDDDKWLIKDLKARLESPKFDSKQKEIYKEYLRLCHSHKRTTTFVKYTHIAVIVVVTAIISAHIFGTFNVIIEGLDGKSIAEYHKDMMNF